ncbi:cytidylate kinase, partial [Bordetella bronchiseptica Bbr77]
HGYFRIRRRRAGHHHRRPHGFRQGHHRAPGSQAAGLGRARQRRPVPVDALAALRRGLPATDEPAVAAVAQALDVRFDGPHVYLEGRDAGHEIRQEEVGNYASRIAAYPGVRQALLERQRAFRQPPGLVADGRDMGTVVFPDASLKIFLVADVEARAQRRCKQLIEKGISANLDDLLRDMRERDARDTQRAVAPLAPAADAHVLDSSGLTIEQTVQAVLDFWRA